MENTLIILLGNRDLQLPASKLSIDYQDLFERNNDAETYFTISKKNREKPFLDISKQILEDQDNYFMNIIEFPMIDSYLSVQKYEKIILTTSQQEPLDRQDCHFIALIAEKFYSNKGYAVEYNPFHVNPTNFGDLVTFFTKIYDDNKESKIFFGNSGGTPDMRAATYFAGIFRNIDFLTLNAREKKANVGNFQKQEQLILSHIVENMLNVYDYEGINQLPIQNEEIKALCRYAINRIALNFSEAKNSIPNSLKSLSFYEKLLEEVNKTFQIRELEQEMYFSAKIKFKQQSYGDYLWRLFTIRENMYIPLIESYLGGVIEYNPANNHASWNRLIDSNISLKTHLSSYTIGRNNAPLKYTEPNKMTYQVIINFANQHSSITKRPFFDDIDNNLQKLDKLRNGIAHQYGSVGINAMNRELQTNRSNIEDFNQKLSQYMESEWNSFGIYQVINNKIRELLNY